MNYYNYINDNKDIFSDMYEYIVCNFVDEKYVLDRKGRYVANLNINYKIKYDNIDKKVITLEIIVEWTVILSIDFYENNVITSFIFDHLFFNIADIEMSNKIKTYLKYTNRKEVINGLL